MAVEPGRWRLWRRHRRQRRCQAQRAKPTPHCRRRCLRQCPCRPDRPTERPSDRASDPTDRPTERPTEPATRQTDEPKWPNLVLERPCEPPIAAAAAAANARASSSPPLLPTSRRRCSPVVIFFPLTRQSRPSSSHHKATSTSACLVFVSFLRPAVTRHQLSSSCVVPPPHFPPKQSTKCLLFLSLITCCSLVSHCEQPLPPLSLSGWSTDLHVPPPLGFRMKMSAADNEEDFRGLVDGLDGDEDLGLFGDLSAFEGTALEEDLGGDLSGGPGGDRPGLTCPRCLRKYKNPRVLSCLHVLCENCLLELLQPARAGSADADEADKILPYSSGRSKSRAGTIICPFCKQETAVSLALLSYGLSQALRVRVRGIGSLHFPTKDIQITIQLIFFSILTDGYH